MLEKGIRREICHSIDIQKLITNTWKIIIKIKNHIYNTGMWTQSKIHGGFVTIYPIDFGHLRCGTDWGYPK